MKAGREDAAAEKAATVEAEDKPAAVVAAAVGAADGAVAATGGGAPSAVIAPAAVVAVEPAVGEQVEEDVEVDLEEQRAKRKREQYELVDKYYEEAALATLEDENEGVKFEEEVADELSEEDDEDVDDSQYSRDSKSRYILRSLRNGDIPYRSGPNKLYGDIACRFCCKIIKNDYDRLIQHATGVDRGSQKKHRPHVKAQHAAFGVFLGKYVKGHLLFHLPRPPHPAKMSRI